MTNRVEQIEAIVAGFEGVQILFPFEKQGELLCGRISISERGVTVPFDVQLYSQYPFQFHGSETIRFINKELLEYNHVNQDGSVCVHTAHHPVLAEKLLQDLNGLRHWVIKYYINKDNDPNYEHIIVGHRAVDGTNHVFLFTDVNYQFRSGGFGRFFYSQQATGSWNKEAYTTYRIQQFFISGETPYCGWSAFYQLGDRHEGLFYFSDKPPVEHKRFAVTNFRQLEGYFSQDFLDDLNGYSKHVRRQGYPFPHVPLLIGYPIGIKEIHWQVILIPATDFPNYGEKILGTTTWITRLHDQPIIWGQTRNSSYQYFYGRGAFHPTIANNKILVIGIGAIGSMVATTLVRGGAKDLTLMDYDIKEPENICRSEYSFFTGLTSKVEELTLRLMLISPFVNISSSETIMDILKMSVHNGKTNWLKDITQYLAQFALIFDCSTDNDLAFILGDLSTEGSIFSLSVTNHARELICVTRPNLYSRLCHLFNLLDPDPTDLYRPTGCWSPTFKASYSDIAALVQFALRHINTRYSQGDPIRTFYLSYQETGEAGIKLTEI
jgi:hypothetical protein